MKKIPWAQPFIFEQDKHYVQEALVSTWISGGMFVDRYEKEFCNYIRSPYGITVSNGTTALYCALIALGIGKGDEVIVSGYTFVAPVNMIMATGATPVFADVDQKTWCIDPRTVEALITSRTKAILVVHVYGNVCNMTALGTIARTHNLFLVEDVAEAAFSRWDGTYAGTCGDVGCFSFQATKTLTMGEGGFVATRDASLCDRLRLLRDHGMTAGKRYWHDIIGYNFRLTNLQAALGCGQLENIATICAERKRIINHYQQKLHSHEGICFQECTPHVDPILWAVAIKIKPEHCRRDRDALMRDLLDDGIETRPGFYSFHELVPYQAPPLPVAHQLGKYIICLPTYMGLSNNDISSICTQLRKRLA